MSENLSLFPEPEAGLKRELATRLALLAAQKLYLGSSSWKYEGWLDTIYSRHRYTSKGKFSKKLFDEASLREYAETFPIVCGDFAFYQFPTPEFWQKLFAQTPAEFLFAFKAPEEITRPGFPIHARYGARAGSLNPNFLNSEMLRTQFLDLLMPFRHRVALIIFEFGVLPHTLFPTAKDFGEALEPFLEALPKAMRFAIEIRNAEFFHPDYLEVLHRHGVAHVFNAWTLMPAVADQIALADAFTADFTAARALLTPGRIYEDALSRFAPFAEVREPNQQVRDALRQLLVRAKRRAEPTYIFINNRLEGFAPGTMLAVAEGLFA